MKAWHRTCKHDLMQVQLPLLNLQKTGLWIVSHRSGRSLWALSHTPELLVADWFWERNSQCFQLCTREFTKLHSSKPVASQLPLAKIISLKEKKQKCRKRACWGGAIKDGRVILEDGGLSKQSSLYACMKLSRKNLVN